MHGLGTSKKVYSNCKKNLKFIDTHTHNFVYWRR